MNGSWSPVVTQEDEQEIWSWHLATENFGRNLPSPSARCQSPSITGLSLKCIYLHKAVNVKLKHWALRKLELSKGIRGNI